MGCLDFTLRCTRILCIKLYSCILEAYENAKAQVYHGGRRYVLLARSSQEGYGNTGILSDSDDDIEMNEAVRKDDEELYEQAKAIVEKKARKKMETLRSKPKERDEEEAWLDSLKADDGV